MQGCTGTEVLMKGTKVLQQGTSSGGGWPSGWPTANATELQRGGNRFLN